MAQDLRGRRLLLTGATSGIGRELALLLGGEGATVLVHGRDEARARATAGAVRAAGGHAETFIADLSSLRDVAQLADEILVSGPIDATIHNAGIGFGSDRRRREVSADGLELRFAVNYLAPYVLAHRLAAKSEPRHAIVNVASAGQADLDWDDVQSERGYDGVLAYRRSKLALIMLTFDLAEAYPNLGVVALHPGTFLDTGMVRDAGIAPLGTARGGAEAIANVLERALAGTTGIYFDETNEARALPQAYDAKARARLDGYARKELERALP